MEAAEVCATEEFYKTVDVLLRHTNGNFTENVKDGTTDELCKAADVFAYCKDGNGMEHMESCVTDVFFTTGECYKTADVLLCLVN